MKFYVDKSGEALRIAPISEIPSCPSQSCPYNTMAILVNWLASKYSRNN